MKNLRYKAAASKLYECQNSRHLELTLFVTWVQLLSLATQKYLVCISDKSGGQQNFHSGWRHCFR